MTIPVSSEEKYFPNTFFFIFLIPESKKLIYRSHKSATTFLTLEDGIGNLSRNVGKILYR
jgi:hypothetical protein